MKYLIVLLIASCSLFNPELPPKPNGESLNILKFEDIFAPFQGVHELNYSSFEGLFVNSKEFFKDYQGKYYSQDEFIHRLDEIKESYNEVSVSWSGKSQHLSENGGEQQLLTRIYTVKIEEIQIVDSVDISVEYIDSRWQITSWVERGSSEFSFFHPLYSN